MLLNYQSWMFYNHFIVILYHFLVLTYWHSSKCQLLFFLPISVFRRKGISNGVQTGWNLRERSFWNKCKPRDLEWMSRSKRGSHEGPGHALGGWAPPHPRGPLVAPLTGFLRLYISIYPENIREHHETLFPPPQPCVPKRSHLGAFFGAPPEGDRSRRASTSTP